MPTVELSLKDFSQLLGKNVSLAEFKELVLFAKGEVDAVEGDLVKVDVKDTNRPDLWSAEGIAREIKGQIGKEKGIPKYGVKKSGAKASVDLKLKGIRPKAAYAVVKNVKVNDELIRQMVQLQEKICLTFGRKRKEVAVGIFDFDKVHGNVKYFAAEPSTEFIPLDFSSPMGLREIMLKHPKGKEYGKLIEGFEKFPLLVDEKNEVLSLPPIINSAGSGKITEKTGNLFIDVTGFRQELINSALEIVCMALADRGGKIESVEVSYGKKKINTPEFKTGKISVNLKEIGEITGMELKKKELESLCAKKRMKGRVQGKKLLTEFPSYRNDILHPVDVVEDLLIAMDYNKIRPLEVKDFTPGKERKEAKELDLLRETCVGMGLQEVLTFVLSSRESQETKIGLKEEEFVEIENPVSANWALLRKHVFPDLLDFLAKNKHSACPQRIFELGKTVELDAESETGVKEKNTLCIALSGSKTGINEVRSALDAVALAFGLKVSLKKASHPAFKEGRCAEVSVGNKKGILGEVSEKVLQNFGLEQKVSVLEAEI